MSHVKTDILIVGAGLVGASLALALSESGLSCLVLEKDRVVKPGNETRPLSLTRQSQQWLQTWGIWPELKDVALPLHTVEVTEAKRFGATVFRAEEQGLPALGYVLPFSRVQEALSTAAFSQENVRIVERVEILEISVSQALGGATVQYRTPEGVMTCEASLLIGADGTHSAIRDIVDFETTSEDPNVSAIIASVSVSDFNRSQANQRFTPEGIVALLPSINSQQQAHLVWSMPNGIARMIGDDFTLTEKLREYWPRRWGRCESVKRLAGYPLKWQEVTNPVRPHCMVIGNAAHTIYPLAAQGFNLSLEDVVVLATVLQEAHRAGDPVGDVSVLRRYWERRAPLRQKRSRVIRGVHDIFSSSLPGLGVLRGMGLLLLDMCPNAQRAAFPVGSGVHD